MPEQKIVDYVKDQLSQGVDKNKIKTDLMMQGSLPSEIDLIFNSLDTATAPSAPMVEAAVNSESPVLISEPAKGTTFKKFLMVIIGILVLVGVVAGVAYAGYGYYTSKQVTIGKAIVNSITAVSSGKIKSGKISLAAEVTAKNVSKNYSDLATDDISNQIVGQLQAVAFKLAYSTAVSKTNDDKIESMGDLSVSIKNPDGGSLGMFGPQEIALKYKTFSDASYLNVQTIPSALITMIPPVVDTSRYLNQWFSIPSEITKSYSDSYTESVSTTTITAEMGNRLIEIFDTSGAISVIDKKAEKTAAGTAVTALYIKIDWDKLGDEMIKINKENSEKDGLTYEESSSLEVKANIQRIKEVPIKNSIFKVLIGADGYIYGFVASGDLMDRDDAQNGNYKVDFSVDSFNQNFVIERPANARSLNEVVAEINDLMNAPVVKKSTKK